jgi:biotin carboxyl carrier protein
MKLQIEVGDRVRTVEVQPHASGYQVVIDGRARLVDAVPVGPEAWSLIVHDAGLALSVEAVVSARRGNGASDVYLDGLHIPVHVRNGRGRRTAETAAVGGASAVQRITAPMPGRVVRVLVAPGADVKARQGLVVVEAMKMENEVRALRDGRVREVLAVEGQSVDAGTMLVVVE